jgi:hypothetical protein
VSINNDAVALLKIQIRHSIWNCASKKNTNKLAPQQAYGLGIDYRDPKYWWVGININYLADSYIDISPIVRTDGFILIPLAAFHFGSHRRKARELLKQEKFDPVVLLNLIGGKSWRIKGKNLGLFARSIMYSPVLIKRVATSKREMLISDNSIRMFPVEHPLLGTNTFTAMEEPISLTSTSIFKY